MENIALIDSFSEFKDNEKYRQSNTHVYFRRGF